MKPEELLLQKKQQMFEIHQQIDEHLTELQTWERPGREIEDMQELRSQYAVRLVQQQRERNARFFRKAWQEIPPAQARQAAPGAAPVTAPPVKKSRKQRRSEASITKKLKETNPMCDYTSYAIMTQMREDKQQRDNSFTPELYRQCTENQVDLRVLRGFCHGCKMKNGQPVDELEAEYLRQDRAFLADYASKELKRREPHLRRMVDEVLQLRLTPDMLTVEYVARHMAYMKNLGDKLTYISNVRKDALNRPFFHRLSPLEQEALDAQESMCAGLGMLCANVMQYHGVGTLDLTYLPPEQIASMRGIGIENLGAQEARTFLSQRNEQLEEAYGRQAQRMIQGEEQKKRAEWEQKKKLDPDSAMGLTGYVQPQAIRILQRCRGKIQSGTQRYQASQQAVDKLYQRIYRAADAWGDLQLHTDSCRAAAVALRDARGMEKEVCRRALEEYHAAVERSELAMEHLERMERQLDALLGVGG